ncbi:MAG TPA: DNA primase [Chthonomonadales bacterium]|nr:DNA primase [Chthonomonadales bacterium]
MRVDKDEIRARNDIVDVIGASVALRRRGRNHVGLCPFHNEKTPSFNVDSVTQTFKCFGCDASGDVFTFVERYQNLSFLDAAEYLARRAGVAFERTGQGQRAGERDRLYQINATALAYYRSQLGRSAFARDYAARRGLTDEALARFQIGFALDSWDSLAGYLSVKKADIAAARQAGLLQTGSSGELFDMFRHRLMFPILDEQERVAGFGGRCLGDEQPKYLNTGETPIFQKSRLLYGLSYARRRIAAEGKALLMEGYMDVIAAHQAGFAYAVATLGTALSEDHARRLARLFPANPTVVLVYDADSAGVRATLKGSEILEKEGIAVRIVRLPEGDDPDSLLRRGESATFQRLIDAAPGRVEYQLDRIVLEADQSTEAGRVAMLRRIVAILASVPSRSERDIYIDRVWQHHTMRASGAGVAKEQMHRDAEAYAAQSRERPRRPAASAPMPPGAGRARPARLTASERAERLLARGLASGEWSGWVVGSATEDDFLDPNVRRLFELVRDSPETALSGPQALLGALDAQGDAIFAQAVRTLLQEFDSIAANEPLSEAVLAGCVERLRQAKIRHLTAEMAKCLQGPVVTEADREQVRAYHRTLEKLKGFPQAPTSKR